MKYKCWYCRTGDQICCDSCADKLSKGLIDNKSNIYLKDVVYLEGFGKSSRAQIDEVQRRVVLNDDGSHYDVGRRGENGKIQERQPNYA